MKLSDYVEKFKELITKCDISGSAALHMFTNGLTAKECKDCMMQKPANLDAFYEAVINLENIETRTNILNPSFGSGSRSECSVSKSGPVRSFALFLVQPDPDRSFFSSNFRQPDQNRHGLVANSHRRNSNRF